MSMIQSYRKILFISLMLSIISTASASEQQEGQKLFKKKCSICHAVDKKKLGPAVNAMSNKEDILRQTIIKGRKSMPAYGEKLTDAEINTLVKYLLANQ